jgi:CMP-N,N'-diacetyllegionaminic acid synthase
MIRVCTICARGGSKGVPGKNVRLLAGRPLLEHTISHAQLSRAFDVIVVSSDSDAVLSLAEAAGVDLVVRRPSELASDRAGKLPAIVHAVRAAEEACDRRFDTIVDLDVTSPLRTVHDVTAAIEMLESDPRATNVISASPARRSPYFNLVELDGEGNARLSKPDPVAILRRQDAPPCFDMNASIYVWRRDRFLHAPRVFDEATRVYEMPEERSFDIDSELDWRIVELLFSGGIEA